MMRLLSVMLVVALSACGYDGSYRYSCQDPKNWESPECNKPVCTADGTCREDLLGE